MREETGYVVRLGALLTVDSVRLLVEDAAEPLDHHGSTDMAAWVSGDAVSTLPRVPLIDIGIAAATAS